MSSSSKMGKGSSKAAKTNTPLWLPPPSSPRTDPILVGQLRAFLTDLHMDPGDAQMAEGSAPLSQDGTARILAAIKQSKTLLLVRIAHLAEECKILRKDLRQNKGKNYRNQVQSISHQRSYTHATSIAELQRTV